MKFASAVLFLTSIMCGANGQEKPNMATAETPSSRSVRAEATVQAPVSEVWRVWTTSQGAQEFFAEKANIHLAIGGPYEIQFDPHDERSGTKGLKILSYAPEEMLSFEWNAPTEYPEVRNGGTWVVVQMRPEGPNRTHVSVTHLGWKGGSEWDQAFAHFVRGWGELMKRLERRFTEGPIDWSKERMMYQESKERKKTLTSASDRTRSSVVKNLNRIEKAWFPVSEFFSHSRFLKPQEHVQSGFDDQVYGGSGE